MPSAFLQEKNGRKMLFSQMRVNMGHISLLQEQPAVLLWASLQVSMVQFSLPLESEVEQVAEARLLVVQRMERVRRV